MDLEPGIRQTLLAAVDHNEKAVELCGDYRVAIHVIGASAQEDIPVKQHIDLAQCGLRVVDHFKALLKVAGELNLDAETVETIKILKRKTEDDFVEICQHADAALDEVKQLEQLFETSK